MKFLNRVFSIFIIGFIFTFFADSKTYSQLPIVIHDLGKYQQEAKAALGDGAFRSYYPAGSYKNRINDFAYIFVTAEGIIETEGGTPRQAFWERYPGSKNKNVTQELMIYKKHQPPSIVIEGTKVSPPFLGEIDPTIKSDSYSYMKTKIWQSLAGFFRVEIRSYVNQNHDDYIIWDGSFELGLDLDGDGVDDMPDQEVNICYAQSFSLAPNQRGQAAYAIEHPYRSVNWRHAEDFPVTLAAGAPRDHLTISLSYHADRTDVTRPHGWNAQGEGGNIDESGAAWGPEEGELTIDNCELIAPQYAGHTTLHADKSVNDTSDDPEIPKTTGKVKLRDLWFGNWTDRYNWMTSGEKELREDEMGYEDPFRFHYLVSSQIQSWGPYKMKKGESFNVE